jgi:hypothetical protein
MGSWEGERMAMPQEKAQSRTASPTAVFGKLPNGSFFVSAFDLSILVEAYDDRSLKKVYVNFILNRKSNNFQRIS